MARLGTFADLLEENTPDPTLAAVCARLRQVVLDGFPNAVEVVRLGDRSACYGLGEKKMSEAHVYIRPAAKHVNLGFFHGAVLRDPHELLEGTGKRLRHVKVRSVEEADDPRLRELVGAALAERRESLGRS